MKQRFSSLDVKVISHELSKSLVSLRIANIYDLSSRIFLFKCAKPGTRHQLLVDSGFRCHLTAFARAAASAPSAFVARLRKYLKSRRITSVAQIGTDRVIEIGFSDGQYRLFLEFFAGGNLVLTDKDYTVLALLRQVSEGDEDVDVKLGSQYQLTPKQNFNGIPALTHERVKETLARQIKKAMAATEAGGKKAKRYKGGEDLRKALSASFSEYPAHLLDHAFKSTGFDPLTKPDSVLHDDALFAKLMNAMEFADETFRGLDASEQSKGYIVAKIREPSTETTPGNPSAPPSQDQILYDDFHPFRPSQFEGKPSTVILEFDGFNKTVDQFYSSIESQKLESKLTEREENAKRKLEEARLGHEKRVGALQQVQELHIRKAQTIEANTHRVEEAIAAINGLIGQGMDWMDIAKLIENEQSRSNTVAQMVKLPLKLYENTVTLLLDEFSAEDESEEEFDITDEESSSDNEEEEEEEEEEKKKKKKKSKPSKAKTPGDKRLAIDIDLALSPWANARQYYDQKKSAAVKEQKTLQASTKALKNTEKKIGADLKKVLKQEKQSLRPARKQFWFEKFLYFVSSDGYLVLGGKDAQQNELLYRRYLKKGDIYVHADLQGAASVIVKNMVSTPDAPIPPSTLSQAGAMSVCTSSAWDSKAVMAAWWVNSDQVSKTAPTGEYLTTGGFVIRGKKNFLPPTQLLLGFAVVFQISEESKVNHKKYRLQPTNSLEPEDVRSLAEDAQNLSLQDVQHADNRAAIEMAAGPDIEHVAENAEVQETADAKVDVEIDREEDMEDDHQSEVDEDTTDQEDDSGSTSEVERDDRNPLQSTQAVSRAAAFDRQEVDNDEGNFSDSSNNGEIESQIDATDDAHKLKSALHSNKDIRPTEPLQSKPKHIQAPRGKRTKAKKAAKKYAEQDEEDRALAMQLLGSTKAQEKKEAASIDRAARDAKLAADKERRRAQHERAAQAERIRQAKLSSGEVPEDMEQDAEVAEQEKLELASLDAFVGTPVPGDEIVAALPIVAPWSALGKCKYKTKLQPGSVKKGKAVREIVTRWTDAGKLGSKVVDESQQDKERVWPREIECIKAWRVEEIIGLLPVGKVRIVQGGGSGGGSGGASGAGGGKGKAGGGVRGGKGSKKGR